ncbi:MAG: ATP-binding cassette domain-containing protein [Oscillospiraceae bacterium]|nr:ATP-binding cassette domain-containing protein [Oscillospiraceae bacterium]
MAVFDIAHLNFSYPECPAPALQDISLQLKQGEFAVLCGATGSGKSTFLRMLKRELTPLGDISGEVQFHGKPLSALDDRTAASAIGFVMQKPEQQIVTDKVWHELAFGLENLHLPQREMQRRIAEIVSYFGIGDWYHRETADLSGGQKQLLNLAAVLAMQPEVLILDEPTAQLDPIAAAEFITTLHRLCEDTGLTILMAEHRLEEAVPVCDRLLVMEHGRLLLNGEPRKVLAALSEKPELLCAMPAAARLACELSHEGDCPLTVREGRRFLHENFNNSVRSLPLPETAPTSAAALQFKDVWLRYEKQGADILRGMAFSVQTGEIFCILGSNGSGKSTTLRAAAALQKPCSGEIRVFGKPLKTYKNQSLYRECLAMLPQDVQTVFLRNTVREELQECGASDPPFPMEHLLDLHPYDLSGGEQQIAALAKVLAANPRLLLLDEPTKGMDAAMKLQFADILRNLKADGKTVVIVTHDVEFAAICADRCAMCFDGQITAVGTPGEFFAGNNFYTTAVSRITRGFFDGAVTLEQAAALCRTNGRKEAAPCL